MADQFDDNYSDKEDQIDYQALFFTYAIHWPWLVLSVAICLACAFTYLRFKVPVYEVSSSVLIKEDSKKSGGSAGGAMDMMKDMGMFSMTSKFDNEVEILKSRTLVKKVVKDMNLNVSYAEKRILGYNRPMYKNSPLEVYMAPEEMENLKGAISLDLDYTDGGALDVDLKYYTQLNEKQTLTQHFDSLPAVLPLEVGTITINRVKEVKMEDASIDMKVTVVSFNAAAAAYAVNLTVEPVSKTATIAAISVKNSDVMRAIDFTHTLVDLYNEDANAEKNEVAQKSADFVEERIRIINGELGSAETELAEFKIRSGLTDLQSDAQMALQETSRYEQQYAQNETQISLVKFLRDYINNPANAGDVIPSNVGLEDKALSSVIDKYNDLVIERKSLLRTSSESNPAIVNLTTSIDVMRHNVVTTVASVLKGLQLTKATIERQGAKYETRINKAPTKEKEFMTISRQQEIKASLYVMLLQKREENAITLAATANNGRIVEEPLPAEKPISPKKQMIYLLALVIGVAIPVGVIYVKEMLRVRIEGHTDVEKLTTVPILGDIPVTDTKDDTDEIAVRENENTTITEVFRNLRTNLLFTMNDGEKERKVILITSTVSGEGKSFVSSNLALSLASMDKKVIIVGLDIRKPGLNKVFKLSTRSKGITSYLANPKETDLFSLIQPSGVSNNLDVLVGGVIPPNPTELLARHTLPDAIELLKQHYDYVVLDTAPIGMVTDTHLIGRVADASLYVCRADYTNRNDFLLINELQRHDRLPLLGLVVNGVDMFNKKYGYYYGYSKYGAVYGYGKKLGYNTVNQVKNTPPTVKVQEIRGRRRIF